MKKLVQLNMLVAAVIMVLTIADLLFLFVLDFPASYETIMLIGGVTGIIIGGFIGLRFKANNVTFEGNVKGLVSTLAKQELLSSEEVIN